MAWTQSEIEALLTTAKAAYTDALSSVSVTSDGAAVQKQRIDSLRAEIDYLNTQLERISNGRKTFIRMRVTI